MSKKKFNFSNLEGLQPVILLEIELNYRYFSIISEVQCWMAMLQIFPSGFFCKWNFNTCFNMVIQWLSVSVTKLLGDYSGNIKMVNVNQFK